MTLTEKCLEVSGLFEAELLIELMLRYWSHPLAEDEEFRNALLEGAADVLRSCIGGEQVLEDIPPDQMNLVAAVWYVEWTTLNNGKEDPQGQRRFWLEKVRQAVPSCFCPPDSLS
jgi:hypothetical protein